MKRVLLISVQKTAHRSFETSLGDSYAIDRVPCVEAAVAMPASTQYEFVFFDASCLISNGIEREPKECLLPLWRKFENAQIVVLAEKNHIRAAVNAVKAGADEYLSLPLDPVEIRLVTSNLNHQYRQEQELDFFRDEFWKKEALEFIKTQSADMKDVFRKVRSVAPTKSTVLLLGETGVGKGVVAKLIHQHSSRSDGPFISVHCGAIPDTLIESELFGHEKGAFTGAVRRKLGRFELAHRGTIFLDEISTISTSLQVKLLKVIQDSTFQRVGGEVDIHVDVRIIAASNVNLKEYVQEKRFRQDLYYRLNVFPVEIPPLRQRKEDIPDFCHAFLRRMNRMSTKQIVDIDDHVVEALKSYEWPGNIRELENLIERAHILERTPRLTLESFPAEVLEQAQPKSALDVTETLQAARQRMIEEFEREYLIGALKAKKGRISETAELAGIGVRQLHKLLTKYGIRKEAFKKHTTDGS